MSSTFALSCYHNIMCTKLSDLKEIGQTILIPKLNSDILLELIDEAVKIMEKEAPIVHIHGEYVVVGDIHGNFYDLVGIFAKNGYPPMKNYIFLGDYVDRGDMSLEVIQFLLVLKMNFPNSVYLLRGNHEFRNINKHYGFYEQIMARYESEQLWNEFNDLFEYFPLGVVVNSKIFCVHGGLSPRFLSLHQLETLHFPIKESELVHDLVWSDPSNTTSSYNINQRGHGCTFGALAVSHFLATNSLSMVIRGHECVDGCRWSFHDTLLTVFSCSYYSGTMNSAGYAIIDNESYVQCFTIPLFKRPSQNDVIYYDARPEEEKPISLRAIKSHSKDILLSHSLLPQRLSRKISYSALPKLIKISN